MVMRLQAPWIAQPTGYAGLGTNPNLILLDNAAVRVVNNGTPGVYTVGLNRSAGALGTGFFFATANNSELTYAIPSTALGTGDFTLLTLYELKTALTDSFCYLFGTNASGGLAYAPRHSSTLTNPALYINGTFKNLGVSSALASAAGVYRAVIVRRSGVVYFYLNNSTGSVAAADTAGTVTTVVLNGYQPGGGAGTAGSLHYFTGLEPRAWGEGEVQAWLANPWRLFGARNIMLPIASVAPTLPTFSAPTYAPGSLTSSGWIPQVTST